MRFLFDDPLTKTPVTLVVGDGKEFNDVLHKDGCRETLDCSGTSGRCVTTSHDKLTRIYVFISSDDDDIPGTVAHECFHLYCSLKVVMGTDDDRITIDTENDETDAYWYGALFDIIYGKAYEWYRRKKDKVKA